MTVHIFCIGRINGNRDIVMRPKYAPASDDAYAIGEMDYDDRQPCDPLKYFSDLASVELYIIGYNASTCTLAPLQEYIDDIRFDGSIEDDAAWIRNGC